MGAQEARQFKSFNDFWILAIYCNYWYGFKSAKCDLNGVKIAIFAAKLQKSPSSCLLENVTCLRSNGLFSTGPKLDNVWAKNIYFWFKPLFFSKTLVALLVAFTPADIFFKRLYRPHAKLANKRCRAYMYECFFKDEYKIVALKYQFLCAKVPSIL